MASIIDAVTNRNCRILQLLIAIPGTFSQQDAESSFVIATRKGYADCVKVFLDSRMNPNMTESSAKSLLMIAAELGHADVVQLLVQAKSNVNMRYRSGETALHFAARCGHEECVSALIEGGANINALDNEGNTPLLLAAKNSRYTHKTMKELVKYGCDLNVRDKQMRTALHHTSYKAMGTELLLSAGADPDVQDVDGNSPIHLAAIEGFDTIVRCLLTYNCNPNLVNKYGKMAVHYVAMKGHEQSIMEITAAGGDLNHLDAEGKIPLWYAVSHNRVHAILALLKANCCPDPPDNQDTENVQNGRGSPLQRALELKLYDVAKQLVLAGGKVNPLREVLVNYARRQREIVQEQAERSTLFRDDALQQEDEVEATAMRWFDDWVQHPHTLCQICRVKILHFLRLKIIHNDYLLHLPQTMKDFIMLRELGE